MTSMPTDRQSPRWGVRTLLFLGLAVFSIGLSWVQAHYTLLSLCGLLIGLIGATVCTARGIASTFK